jgi:Ceramidase
MRESYRKVIVAAAALAAIIGVSLLEPIPQDPSYHGFADRRAFQGLPNFWNVASNLPFLLVGALGLLRARQVAWPPLTFHYAFYCTAVAIVGLGSAFYHLNPSNATLVWDRLPMTVAFMTLFSAVLADRVSWRVGRAMLWPLVIAGIVSIAWWVLTEQAGAGDLRAYAIVQFLPMLLVPLVLLLWRNGSGVTTQPLVAALAVYAVAKGAELADFAIWNATGFVSGHTLKHLLAALAAWLIVRAFQMSPASAL